MKDGTTPIASFRLGETTMNELKSCVALLELIGKANGEFIWVKHDRTEVIKRAVSEYQAKLRAQYVIIQDAMAENKTSEPKGDQSLIRKTTRKKG